MVRQSEPYSERFFLKTSLLAGNQGREVRESGVISVEGVGRKRVGQQAAY
jgi:hypothetical protein